MSQDVQDVLSALQAANDKLDAVGTSLSDISGDIQTLNDKITALETDGNGATAEEVAQIKTLTGSLTQKVNTLADQASAIDLETPPSSDSGTATT